MKSEILSIYAQYLMVAREVEHCDEIVNIDGVTIIVDRRKRTMIEKLGYDINVKMYNLFLLNIYVVYICSELKIKRYDR